MTDVKWDKEGNITNEGELTPEEVVGALKAKNQEIHTARVNESEKARVAREEADKAKKDLEEAQKAKPEEKKEDPKQPDISEELKLIARGLSDEEISRAKKVAKGEDITLTEALQSEMFLAWQKDHKAKLAAEASKLGPAGGSSQGLPVEGITPGMSKEEHKKIWEKALGRDTA